MGARERWGGDLLRQRTPVRGRREVRPSYVLETMGSTETIEPGNLSPSGRWGVDFARGERRKSIRPKRRWRGGKKNRWKLGSLGQRSFERLGITPVGGFFLPFAFPGVDDGFTQLTRRLAGKGFFQTAEQSGFL
jgi:hypothetical protein